VRGGDISRLIFALTAPLTKDFTNDILPAPAKDSFSGYSMAAANMIVNADRPRLMASLVGTRMLQRPKPQSGMR